MSKRYTKEEFSQLHALEQRMVIDESPELVPKDILDRIKARDACPDPEGLDYYG